MKFKDLVDSHPLPILVGVAFTVASTTAGVVTFVESSKYEGEKIKIENEYRGDISNLKTKLASIERKIGADEKTYFDVSQLIITPDRVKALDGAYKSANDGEFFYALPVGERWIYDVVSELEFAALKLDHHDLYPGMKKFQTELGEKNVHIWRNKQNFTIIPRAKKGMENAAPKSVRFFPSVAVQYVRESDLKSAARAFVSDYEDESKFKKLTRQFDDLPKDVQTSTPVLADSATSSSIPATSHDTANQHISGERQLEMENSLNSLFRGDLAGLMLLGITSQAFQLTQLSEGVEVSLNSVQKKGNVLYMNISIKFTSANISELLKPTNITVDQEIFIVTNTKGLYIVKVEVPTIDGRSDAYPWVGQFLSSIRIPI